MTPPAPDSSDLPPYRPTVEDLEESLAREERQHCETQTALKLVSWGYGLLSVPTALLLLVGGIDWEGLRSAVWFMAVVSIIGFLSLREQAQRHVREWGEEFRRHREGYR